MTVHFLFRLISKVYWWKSGGKAFFVIYYMNFFKNVDVVAFITSINILFAQLHIILNSGGWRNGQQTLLNVKHSSPLSHQQNARTWGQIDWYPILYALLTPHSTTQKARVPMAPSTVSINNWKRSNKASL